MGEYQDRKDIDRLYDDLYDKTEGLPNVLTFEENSPYRNIQSKSDGSDRGTIDALLNYYQLDNWQEIVLNIAYPVGSIYISVNNINPSEIFGGEWIQLKDTFLLACGDTYNADPTVQVIDDEEVPIDTALHGEASHELTIDEMPSHSHNTEWSIWNQGTDVSTSANAVNWSSHGTTKVNGISENGGGAEHNNMPPYLAVYMWERVN